jgi:murein DD-endopeptidase MepM/ murein hydrolase activator NlpD
LAVAAGTVVTSGTDERYGNYVQVDHGQGRSSFFAHLDRAAVNTGDRVQAGQVIGAVGATGFATGPHLHLEYRQDGEPRDPQRMYADLDEHATARALARRNAQRHAAPPIQE